MTKITLADQLVNGTIAAALPLIAPVRRRARLNGSCAVAALLALPAAMSVGILLARPARAQTDIISNKSATVILGNTTNYPDGNPFTIENGYTVNAPTGDGVYGNTGTNWTLTNYGVVIGGTANGVGFGSGGTIDNGLSDSTVGTITGATDGLYTTGSLGVINNIGVVTGSANSGIEMRAGGSIYNQSQSEYTGTITGGGDGVLITGAAASINNAGTITGLSGDGVNNQAGGYVDNDTGFALISGAQTGVQFTGAYGSASNFGSITGGTLGISMNAGGRVNNYETGFISGGATGVAVDGGGTVSSTIGNAGLITGAAYGVSLGGGIDSGTFDNGSGTLNSVYNIGTIAQTSALPAGDHDAGVFLSGTGVIYNGTAIEGDASITNPAALIEGATYGVFENGGTVGIANGGTIIGTAGSGVMIEGTGFVDNLNKITGSASGVTAEGANSAVLNAGEVYGSTYGVKLTGGDGTVGNFGLITASGEGGIGVRADDSGVLNYGAIIGNGGGVIISGGGFVYNGGEGLISGAIGVGVDGGGTVNSSIINYGLITGSQYGVSLSGGTGNIDFGTFGSMSVVFNNGTIQETGNGSNAAGIVLSGAAVVYNGVTLGGGGTISNPDALIQGVSYGVLGGGGTMAVANAGTIIGFLGSGVLLSGTGLVDNVGTILGNMTGVTEEGGGSLVFNAYDTSVSAPLISGANDGVLMTGTAATMVNIGTVVGYSANDGNPTGTGVSLGNGGFLINAPSASNFPVISGASYGIDVTGADGYLFNSGYVVATNGSGTGVALGNGGYLSNTSIGTIQGGSIGVAVGVHEFGTQLPAGIIANAGSITGGEFGVSMAGYGVVNNTIGGYIRGDHVGVYIAGGDASVNNIGTITTQTFTTPNIVPAFRPFGEAQSTGVSFANGGAVYNGSGGYIYGGATGVAITGGVPSSVTNAAGGYIKGGATGVFLNGGNDQLYNAGVIYGGLRGAVLGNGGTVYNSGSIAAASADGFAYGVSLTQGGNVTNTGSGLIYGYQAGIEAAGAPVTIVNDGTITAPGVVMVDTSAYRGVGVYTYDGGTLTNGTLGLISGYGSGVLAYGTMGITNLGTIQGKNGDGVSLDTGSVANSGIIYGSRTGVYIDYGNITNAAGGTISAYVNAVDMRGGGADSLGNAGTIISTAADHSAVHMGEGGTVNNTGFISGSAYGVYVESGLGTVINTGTIIETSNANVYYAAVYLFHGGSVSNLDGGTLQGASDGIVVSNAAGTIFNAGLIDGIGYDGVSLNHGGSVVNSSGGTILGAHIGVYTGYAGASVANYGIIAGASGDGVSLYEGGSLFNAGTITGGYAGAYVTGLGSQVQNEGFISGAVYGVLAAGGSILNGPTAGIIGGSIGVAGVVNPVDVENLGGVIDGAGGIGVSLAAGGNVVNYEGGTISGEDVGVQLASAGTVINAGSIVAFQSGVATITGVRLLDGGYVHNYAPGYIAGYAAGVYLGGGGTVALRNEGRIYGYRTGVALGGGGTVMNSGSIISSNIGLAGTGGVTQVFNSGSIDGADEIGVTLASGGDVENGDSGVIYGQYTGVDLAENGTVLNAGVITTETDGEGPNAYSGVLLQNGGYVHNDGSGSIYGYTNGVFSAGGAVSVINEGLISGYGYGVDLRNPGTPSVIVNAGTLIGTGEDSSGVFAEDGRVINQQSGVIIGQYAVEMSAGTLLNAGQITGVFSGVSTDGSLVANYAAGTITGGVYGVGIFSGSGTLLNSGTIAGAGSFGVTLAHDGVVDNDAGGVISGGSFGLSAHGTVAVTNSGTISGAADTGIGINYGAVINTQGGTIIGGDVGISSGYADVTNAGFITGGFAGVSGYQMGVNNLAAGTIAGASGVSIYGDLAAVTNAGTIIGHQFSGVVLSNGGTVTNLAGGGIYGYANGISASSFADIDNSGIIDGATDAGVYLNNGGTVLNRLGGEITSNDTGVYAKGAAAVVTNAGEIGGYYGVRLLRGGAVYNLAGATIASSGDAVDVENAAVTIVNEGAIIASGNDYSGINIFSSSTGTIENTGMVSGGEYGMVLSGGGVTLTNYRTGRISGGYQGVNADDATITNAGSITGGSVGAAVYGGVLNNLSTGTIKGGAVGLYADAGAAVTNAGQILDDSSAGAVLGNNTTLTNLPGGVISGEHGVDFNGADSTLFNAGTIASTEIGGAAIAFENTNVNYLTLSTGAVIDGIIDGGGSGSQIELIGAGTLGNTIQDFAPAGALSVASGANWTGTGDWSIATVTNNGTFQGGQLNKPLSLTGNFIQASLATLKVVVTPTLSSQFLITGAAQLAGKLTYVFAPGYYTPHTYDFLTASDGVTGDFAAVTYGGLVPPQLTHTTNAAPPGANLVLSGNGVVTPADDGVFNAQSQTMADSAQQANTSLLGKASQGAGAGASAAAACAAEAGAAHNTATGSATTASRMASAVAVAFCGAGGWIEATGTEMNADASGGAADYHADTGGFLAGLDKAVNGIGTRIGLAVGYDETWLHDGDNGKANTSTVRVGLYAAQPLGRFTIAADVMYGHGSNTTHRATGIGQANANYGTDIYSGAVQGSTELFLGPVDLIPAAGLRVAHVSSGSFAETGSGFVPAFAVSGSGAGYTSVQPFVNMGMSHSFLTPSGLNITPSAGIGFIYEAADRGKAVDVTAGDFTSFAATHNNLDRATAVLSAGIAAGRDNWSLFAHYTAYVSGNWTSQTAEAGLQVKF